MTEEVAFSGRDLIAAFDRRYTLPLHWLEESLKGNHVVDFPEPHNDTWFIEAKSQE